MFKKKTCKNCERKVSDSYDFCPYCGNDLLNSKKNQDWGMLGRNDIDNFNNLQMPMGLGAIFNTLVKSLDKQFNELERDTRKSFNSPMKKNGISINISTSENNPPKIKIREFGNQPKKQVQKEIKGKQIKNLSKERIKQFSKLPKKEPSVEMKRFSDSLVYEIKMPGVSSIDDIAITKLENSIEIKALGEKYIYSKIIPLNLPIINYSFEKENLVLELRSN